MDINEYLHKTPKKKRESYPLNVRNMQERTLSSEETLSADQAKKASTAKCCLCGKSNANMYAATNSDRWVPYRPAYNKNVRRFLCKSCARLHRPSVLLSLLSGNVQAIKRLPVFDSSGNLLPTVTHEQIKLLPQFYPLTYLGDKKAIVTILSITELIDCQVLKLDAKGLDEYYVKAHMDQFGYIFTTCPLWYEVLKFPYPKKVQFINFWDKNDRLRTSVLYSEKKFEH